MRRYITVEVLDICRADDMKLTILSITLPDESKLRGCIASREFITAISIQKPKKKHDKIDLLLLTDIIYKHRRRLRNGSQIKIHSVKILR